MPLLAVKITFSGIWLKFGIPMGNTKTKLYTKFHVNRTKNTWFRALKPLFWIIYPPNGILPVGRFYWLGLTDLVKVFTKGTFLPNLMKIGLKMRPVESLHIYTYICIYK